MNTSFRQSLKAQAHHLKPVVLLGAKGLTDAVVAETHIALETHELIKVKISGAEKEDRQAMAQELCSKVQAEMVQMIGTIVVLYRKKKKN